MKEHTKGRVTIPTDLDVVPETLELLERWGADAIRDCDGTDYPGRTEKRGCKSIFYVLYDKEGQCMGQGKSGRDPADVHHDALLYGCKQ